MDSTGTFPKEEELGMWEVGANSEEASVSRLKHGGVRQAGRNLLGARSTYWSYRK